MSLTDITIAITSCGRYSLLEKMVASIEQNIDISGYTKIITEDSQDREHIEKMKEANANGFLKGYNIIYTAGSWQDDVLKRHYFALKTLYENIHTKYVFHCEDDQVFYRVDYNFIELSYRILESQKHIAIVILWDLFRDFGIQKEGIMRSRYYDILTDEEFSIDGHDFTYCQIDATFALQPWLRCTDRMRQAMFWYEETINEVAVSRRLASILGVRSLYIKKGIYYNPGWRMNSTRNMRSMGYIKYIRVTLKNAISYRYNLLKRYIRYILINK